MEYINNYDFYEIRFGSILSDSDRKVLIDLYQPIVGAGAIALFFKLWSDAENDREKGFYSIDRLLNNMQVTSSELLLQRRHLEALGLIKTYQKELDEQKRCFMFCLFAPKQPREFFADPFFNGILTKYIGEKEVQKIASLYKMKIDTKDYKEVTASFGEVYLNEINSLNSASSTKLGNLKGRTTGNIYTQFDGDKFIAILVNQYHLSNEFLSKDEVNYLSKIASIYGIDEETAAKYIEYYCDYTLKRGSRVDVYKLTETFKNLNEYSKVMPKKTKKSTKDMSNGKYADLIKLMEQTPATKYLSYLQNNTTPSQADLELIESLATNFNLPNGIINALISYTLEVKNNTLPRKYVEKVAASLVREGVTSVIEALNYLNKVNKSNKDLKEKKSTYKTKNENSYFDSKEEVVEFNPNLEDEDDDE
ncbi:MAG: DnaD domain protein [Erysipelotrichales bacterium]|nr:DnaD domain protein [Erysipelotrichales bacterium]